MVRKGGKKNKTKLIASFSLPLNKKSGSAGFFCVPFFVPVRSTLGGEMTVDRNG